MAKKLTDYRWIVHADGSEYYHVPVPVAEHHDRLSAAKDAVIEAAEAVVESGETFAAQADAIDKMMLALAALKKVRDE